MVANNYGILSISSPEYTDRGPVSCTMLSTLTSISQRNYFILRWDSRELCCSLGRGTRTTRYF